MDSRTKTALDILKAAALSGIVGNLLLRETPWGLSALLFVTLFAAAVLLLSMKWRPALLTANRIALLGSMVFFAAMFLFRDSEQLLVFDTIAILVIMGVLVLETLNINVRIAGVIHYVFGFIWSGLTSVFAPLVLLIFDVDWKDTPRTPISRQVFPVLRGAAIALPLLLIFGALFSAADARFEELANRWINFDLGNVISHVAITSVLAWLSAGYFRGSVVTPGFAAGAEAGVGGPPSGQASGSDESDTASSGQEDVSLPGGATVLEHINRSDAPVSILQTKIKTRDWQDLDSSSLPHLFTLGRTEVAIILGLINALFLGFVILQLPYLFGGMDLVQGTPDLTLAEYARRGFGELVVVSLLVLPVLLISHWLLRRGSKNAELLFRVLAGVQIGLLFLIMASAAQRLILLTGETGYGLTTTRFYPMMFMIWLAVVFVWFAFTVLRGSRQHFAWGALWAAIVVLAATNMVNPDAFIARTNIALMQHGRDFDGPYNARELSNDAVPEVLSAVPAIPSEDQCEVRLSLLDKYRELEALDDPRTFNFSRRRAFGLLKANEAVLLDTEGCPPLLPFRD